MAKVARFVSISCFVAAAAALAGCVGFNGAGSGPAAEAPTYHVGDRWVYHAEDGFLVKTVWDETHEIIAIGAAGTTVRVTKKGSSFDTVRTEQWPAPGLVRVGAIYDDETRRFVIPLKRYVFPLAAGQSWTQWIDNFNEERKSTGPINHYVRVHGWEKVTTPAGTFDAVAMYVIARLDDEEFWRYPTECGYTVWYAPSARGVVKERKEAQYLEKGHGSDGGAGKIRTQSTAVELISFTPGRS